MTKWLGCMASTYSSKASLITIGKVKAGASSMS